MSYSYEYIDDNGIGFTALLAIASLLPSYVGGKDKKFDLNLITKELLVYLITLLYLLLIFWEKRITLFTSLIMISVFPIYIYCNKGKSKEELLKKGDEETLKPKPTIR